MKIVVNPGCTVYVKDGKFSVLFFPEESEFLHFREVIRPSAFHYGEDVLLKKYMEMQDIFNFPDSSSKFRGISSSFLQQIRRHIAERIVEIEYSLEHPAVIVAPDGTVVYP